MSTLTKNNLSRRQFLGGVAGGIFVTGIQAALPLPAWAVTSPRNIHEGVTNYPAQNYFDLKVEHNDILLLHLYSFHW